MVVRIHYDVFHVRKFTQSQFRSKTYDIHICDCYPVTPQVPMSHDNLSVSEDSSYDEHFSISLPPPQVQPSTPSLTDVPVEHSFETIPQEEALTCVPSPPREIVQLLVTNDEVPRTVTTILQSILTVMFHINYCSSARGEVVAYIADILFPFQLNCFSFYLPQTLINCVLRKVMFYLKSCRGKEQAKIQMH